jgi:ParB family chromosome partitioning protein
MARKDVLSGLLAMPMETSAAPAAAPRAQKGAIGAVSRSIADLKARAVIELDPDRIEAGGMQDRLEHDADEDSALARSIAEYGQQVPVLVRPHPELEGQFQIVFGRRRLLAMRALGRPVKALVRDLDDRALVLAQGQENTARRDLSFIEKVNFARQMQEAGYDRKVICDALTVDKTLASRMLSVADRLSPEVIEAIGAAPAVGRDRWLALVDLLTDGNVTAAEVVAVAARTRSDRSDDRFQAVWDHMTAPKPATLGVPPPADPRAPEPRMILATDGAALGQATFGAHHITLKLRLAQTDGFEDWLLDNLPTLLSDWQARR